MKISFIIQYLVNVRIFTLERISTDVQNISRCLAIICHCISMKELVLQKIHTHTRTYSKAFTYFSYFNYPQKLHTGEKVHIQIVCQTFKYYFKSLSTPKNSVSFTVQLHISLHFLRKTQLCGCLDQTNLKMCPLRHFLGC